MKIKKIINNNTAIVIKGGHESIVFSTGISFKKKKGETINTNEIEKIYVLDSTERLEHFSYLLSKTSDEVIVLINNIVKMAEKNLNCDMNDYLYLTLLDHISFAFERIKKGQFIVNPLKWEVKKFYPQYYDIGLEAVSAMNKSFGIEFSEDEAISIALHFINAQEEKTYLNEKIDEIETLTDVLNIIKYHFNIVFDEESINYIRLVTHLQFFISRLNNKEMYEETDTLNLYEQVRAAYPSSYSVISKIKDYTLSKYQYELSKSEMTYLMIHINRLIERKD
ncbi:PRD domain-containing protein [Vagococcus sp. JNUCC 83]